MIEHQFELSVNTGFLVNRYTDPKYWVKEISSSIGIDKVQFTADLINPSLPDELIQKKLQETKKELAERKVSVTSTFTGAFTRLNNLTHPDEDFRDYYQNWFLKFVDISSVLESRSVGSHFGILTQPDLENEESSKRLTEDAIKRWVKIGKYAKDKGIETIFWEPMSIAREYGETIDKAIELNSILNSMSDVKFSMCLDVDHGDLESKNKDDIDPYEWLSQCADSYDMVHLKQSYENKGGHWPFTKEHNAKGKIIPERIINTIKDTKPRRIELVLELSFKERQPADRLAVSNVSESVNFWKHSLA